MAAEPRFAPQAVRDLEEIWLYIAEDNPEAADRTVDRLVDVARTLAAMPKMGRARPELRPDCRSFPVDQFVIFYRSAEGTIEVLRCARGARAVETLF